MSLFSGKKQKQKSVALLDIGTSSIGAAFGVHDATGTHILWQTRIEYGYTIQDHYERYVKEMGARLLEIGSQFIQEGARVAQHNPSFSIKDLEVWCIFAPPWFFADVGVSKKKYTTRTTIAHSSLDSMRSEILETIKSKPAYSAWEGVAGAHRLLEQIDLAVYLDGYQVSATQTYTAREAKLVSYLAVIPQRLADNLTEITNKIFPNHKIHLTTSTKFLASQSEAERAILIEIGGQVTSVATITDNKPAGITTFPVGSHHLMRAIAPKEVGENEARSTCAQALNSADLTTFSKTTENALSAWHTRLEEAIRIATKGVTPPLTTSLAVEPMWYPLFTYALEQGTTLAGLRETKRLTPTPCYVQPEKVKADTPTLGEKGTDTRLYTFLTAVYSDT